MPEPIKIGIIGGGMISQVAHLPFYEADARCELVAVAEERPSLVAALAERYPGLRVVPHHHDILGDTGIGAVVIVGPRPSMGPLALEALQAGKHVMMEKPMAHTAAQAARLVAAAEAGGLTLAIGFMKRYDPGIEAAWRVFTELQTSRRLGELVLARFYDFSRSYAVPPPAHTRPRESRTERFEEWPLWPEWLAGRHRETFAWFVNAASHDLNLVTVFFEQDVEVLSAFSPSSNAVLATLAAGGVPIEFAITRSAIGVWREGIEFLFENGRLSIAIPSPMAVDQCARVVLEENVEHAKRTVVETGSGWAFERQAHGFIDALSGLRRPMTTGKDGLRDLQLCEQIWQRISGSRDERSRQNP
jgi:predicted dehydrogenase